MHNLILREYHLDDMQDTHNVTTREVLINSLS